MFGMKYYNKSIGKDQWVQSKWTEYKIFELKNTTTNIAM